MSTRVLAAQLTLTSIHSRLSVMGECGRSIDCEAAKRMAIEIEQALDVLRGAINTAKAVLENGGEM